MKLSQRMRGWLYALFTALVFCFSLWLLGGMHSPGRLESGYFSACLSLFVFGMSVMGIGVYAMLSFRATRKAKRPADALFAVIVGLAVLIVAVTVIMTYGGLERPFGEAGYTAANIMVAILSLLPVPWIVRLFAVAFCNGEDPAAGKTALRFVAVALLSAVPVLTFTGLLFRFFHF